MLYVNPRQSQNVELVRSGDPFRKSLHRTFSKNYLHSKIKNKKNVKNLELYTYPYKRIFFTSQCKRIFFTSQNKYYFTHVLLFRFQFVVITVFVFTFCNGVIQKKIEGTLSYLSQDFIRTHKQSEGKEKGFICVNLDV